MTRARYRFIRYRGITFMFKSDPANPMMLHIYARHLMQPADAIRAWFDGHHSYNAVNDRFEATSHGVGLYWFWRDHQRDLVMVVSCFAIRVREE